MSNRADNFNRADGSLLGSTPSDGGSAWGGSAGGTIVSNTYKENTAGAEFVYLDSSSADVDIAVTLTTLPAAFGEMTLMFRGVDVNNCWDVDVRAGATPTTAGIWKVVKRVTGTNTNVTSGTGPALTTGSIIRVRANGTSINVYHTPSGGSESEVTVLAATSQSFNQTATLHGFGGGGTFADATARFDNFSITNLSGGGGGTPPNNSSFNIGSIW